MIQVNENKLRSSMPKSAIILKVEEEAKKKKTYEISKLSCTLDYYFLLFVLQKRSDTRQVAVQKHHRGHGQAGGLQRLAVCCKIRKSATKIIFFKILIFSPLMQLNQYFVLKKIFLGYCWLLFPSKYSMIKKANS